MNRDFKGVWIPKEIWLNKEISLQAKVLWAEIWSLHDQESGGSYASNEYLCEFMGFKLSRLKEVMKELRDNKLLEEVSFNGRERVIRANCPDIDYGGEQTAGKPATSQPVSRIPTYIENKEKKKKKKNSSELAAHIQFDYSTNQFIHIEESDFADWQEMYPSVNITLELKKMRQWLMDPSNPERDGNRTFITNWLSRASKEASKAKKSPSYPGDDTPGQFDSQTALKILKKDGENDYIDYLKSLEDKTYFLDHMKGKFLPLFVDFMKGVS